jgi:hypothetical protein
MEVGFGGGGRGAMGILVFEGGIAPCGGGRGAMPTLEAAAAAADAYFRVSPGALAGAAAGFILALEEPFVIFDNGVCKVARAGKGLLSCVDGLLAAATGGSGADAALGFPPAALADRPSASGTSSCID